MYNIKDVEDILSEYEQIIEVQVRQFNKDDKNFIIDKSIFLNDFENLHLSIKDLSRDLIIADKAYGDRVEIYIENFSYNTSFEIE